MIKHTYTHNLHNYRDIYTYLLHTYRLTDTHIHTNIYNFIPYTLTYTYKYITPQLRPLVPAITFQTVHHAGDVVN